MRVLVLPADLGRCGYRLAWPALALRAQGADVHVIPPGTSDQMVPPTVWPVTDVTVEAVWQENADGHPEFVTLAGTPDCDVLVMQRPLERQRVDLLRAVQARGVKVVVEIDDNFSHVSARNTAFSKVNPRINPNANFNWLTEACRLADAVTVTTPRLAAQYGPRGKARIIPNHVPRSYLDVRDTEARERVTVGWSGSVHTHPDDLQTTRGQVARAVKELDLDFRVIGTGTSVARHLGLDRVMACQWVPLSAYPERMAALDIGIVPLERSVFNESKSGLKGLEWAAVGVPAVVPATTGPYRAQSAHAGLLADGPKGWYRHVRTLAQSKQARDDEIGRARAWAGTQTIEGNCGMWWDAWESVVA